VERNRESVKSKSGGRKPPAPLHHDHHPLRPAHHHRPQKIMTEKPDIPEYDPTFKETMEEVTDNLLFFIPLFFLFGLAAYLAAYGIARLVVLFL
jgi:hypothetical protein